jgi:hypothetical protein
MRPPIERFQLAPHISAGGVLVIDPIVATTQPGAQPAMRLHGVQRWVDRHGVIRLAGFSYRVPIILAGEPVEAVVADHLVRVFHRDVLVAEHVQRRKPDNEAKEPVQGRRTARPATSGLTVTRVADSGGGRSRSPPPTGSATPGGAAVCRSRWSPARCSWPATGRSSGSTRSATTGPENMARSPPRTGGPATTRMRRPGPASRHAAAGSPAGRALTPTPHTGAISSGPGTDR